MRPDLPLTLAILVCLAVLVLVLVMPMPDDDAAPKPDPTPCQNRHAPEHWGRVTFDKASGKYLCGRCWMESPVARWERKKG